MRQFTLILIALLLLVGCSVDEIYLVVVNPETHTPAPTIQNPTETDTPIATNTPTPTLPPTITSSPIPPTNTPTPTQVGTLDPTPTRESLIQIRLNANSNIRTSPPESAFIRVAPLGTVFTVFSQRPASGVCVTQWLDVGNGEWLCNGSWVTFISGNIDDVPFSQISQASRLGYNTLEVFDEAYYINHLLAICPAYMLVMDNLPLADKVYRALHEPCGTEVIHRDWHPANGDEFVERTPEQFVNQWIRQGYPHLIRYTTNEVSCGGNIPCSVYVAHEVRIAQLAHDAGFRVALGNTGVGKFTAHEVISGVYNPLVQAAVQYNHLLSFHEYTWGSLSFGFGSVPTDYLLDPNLMQQDQWVSNIGYQFADASAFNAQAFQDDLIPFGVEQLDNHIQELLDTNELIEFEGRLYDSDTDLFSAQIAQEGCGNLPPYWHMGRSFWILLWYECTIGGELPDIVHTEWGWDYMADVNHVIEPLRNDFAHPQYEFNLRGWRSLEHLWQWWWPEWSTSEAAYNQIEWAIDQYPEGHYFLLFAWSDSSTRDWTRAGFSYGNYGDAITLNLHRLLEQNPIR